LKEKRRKRPFDERVMTIEKIRIHVLILNVPQPLLRALRQSRTRSSRVRYSHRRRRRRSSSCRHFLEQQQPQQKGFEGEKFVMLFLGKEYYFFSLLCLFLVNSSSSTKKKEKSTSCNSESTTFSLFLSLFYSNDALIL
jgi:hypothetical protein